jgi:hypothetical protein
MLDSPQECGAAILDKQWSFDSREAAFGDSRDAIGRFPAQRMTASQQLGRFLKNPRAVA